MHNLLLSSYREEYPTIDACLRKLRPNVGDEMKWVLEVLEEYIGNLRGDLIDRENALRALGLVYCQKRERWDETFEADSKVYCATCGAEVVNQKCQWKEETGGAGDANPERLAHDDATLDAGEHRGG